jgi:hypothetical protein
MIKYIFLGGMLLAAIGYWVILLRSFRDKNK